MCDLWKKIKIEGSQLKNIDELTPEVRLLGCGFFVTIQNADNDIPIEIIKIIENYQLFGETNF